MVTEITTGTVYRRFDRLVRSVESWPVLQSAEAVGCEPESVRARVVQRIVEICSDDFTILALQGQAPEERREVVLGGVRLSLEERRAVATPRLWFVGIMQFFGAWARVATQLFRTLARIRRRSAAPVTVLIGATVPEGSDERFARFCRSGPIAALADAQRVVIEWRGSRAPSSDGAIAYRPDPLGAIAEALPWTGRLRVVGVHLTAPFLLLGSIVKSPISVLVARDLARIPVVRYLDRRGLIDAMVVTNSAFTAQPLWMNGLCGRRFGLHMIWYSQNFLPKVYVGEQERSDLPAARHMRVDDHWVWTEGFASYLRTVDQRNIHVVGPILWYLDEAVSPPATVDGLKVAVFDITPFSPGANSAFSAARNYYSARTITQFITDIVAVCDDIATADNTRVSILVKHKRGTSTRHDALYIEYLERLLRDRPNVTLLPHDTDLFALLRDCDISVSVPYTSTAYLGAHLGRPALYYDPFAELVPLHEPNEHVEFCAGPDQLMEALGRVLEGRADRSGTVLS